MNGSNGRSSLPTIQYKSELDVPTDVLQRIERYAYRRHPLDAKTQRYVIQNQISSYHELVDLESKEIPNKELFRLKKIAARAHPDDYSTQLYNVREQIAAYGKLRFYADPTITQGILANIKEQCRRDHPDDYATQLFALPQRIQKYHNRPRPPALGPSPIFDRGR